MEEFKNYYKFPLKMWDDFTVKVFTEDNNMAFDWTLPTSKGYDNIKQQLLNRINGLECTLPEIPGHYLDGINIMMNTPNGAKRIAVVRGWGMLTGTGGYNLDANKAAEIQDAFAQYIVDMLNKK